ncbi:MAG: metallophosphoesterase [Spirochaetaceae bacterium]|nr:metallophosphoesterase [Myxococcales bacterium]MCB9726014.1 metallophosphoesterase [Spirochaetaceae bacterium]
MSVVAHHLASRFLHYIDESIEAPVGRSPGTGEPLHFESWAQAEVPKLHESPADADTPSERMIRHYLEGKTWVAPRQPICFLTDLHADREAFWRSLIVAGVVDSPDLESESDEALAAIPDEGFALTPFGRDVHLVIGGDLFDKGPANLPLLDAIGHFAGSGVHFTLLAGNHDVRTFLGIRHAEATDPGLAHLFVRMGKKTMTLFREVFETHLAGGDGAQRLSDEAVRSRLFPQRSWFEEFPKLAQGLVPPARIEKELKRIQEKTIELEARCRAYGMSLGDMYAALERARGLFLDADGPYHWVFSRMHIAMREGSMLFAHAGVDDEAAAWIAERGCEAVQESFREALETTPFELYNGPLGNVFRTKYRDLDLPMTDVGRHRLQRAGVYAIVHGHRNVFLGQHMNFRRGVLNFACDACVDRNTRRIESLAGEGAAATIIAEDGTIYGLSSDHPAIKVFDPAAYGGWVTSV